MKKKYYIFLLLILLVSCKPHEVKVEKNTAVSALEDYVYTGVVNHDILLLSEEKLDDFNVYLQSQLVDVLKISIDDTRLCIHGKVKDLFFPVVLNEQKQVVDIEFSMPVLEEVPEEQILSFDEQLILERGESIVESIKQRQYDAFKSEQMELVSWKRKEVVGIKGIEEYFDFALNTLSLQIDDYSVKVWPDTYQVLGSRDQEPIILITLDKNYEVKNIDFPLIRYLSNQYLIFSTSYYTDEMLFYPGTFCELNNEAIKDLNSQILKNIDNISRMKEYIETENWQKLYTIMTDEFTKRVSFEEFLIYMRGQSALLGKFETEEIQMIYYKMNNLYVTPFFFSSYKARNVEEGFDNRFVFEMPMYPKTYNYVNDASAFQNIYFTKTRFDNYENSLKDEGLRKKNVQKFIKALQDHDYPYQYEILVRDPDDIAFNNFVAMSKVQEKIAGSYDGVFIEKRSEYAEDLGVYYIEYLVGNSKGFGRLILELNGEEEIVSFNTAQLFTVDEAFEEVSLWH
ncbi:MAG: hypothetical protein JXR88_01080 [Clostridia bacterium]|nr:hypothetical protein [Clostridia bacterium]